ncbi:MAG: DNA-directed RNA polymerase subunit A', partial [Candidatus Diapherotrites archaeon]|nr:DNA-directed RNA polymerase subunit A' [Candidatus Diapherotrites archaeon]
MTEKILSEIKFSFLDPERVRSLSTVEINSAQTYDIDGYPIEGGLMDPHLGVIGPGLRCKSCSQRMGGCPGHFGHLELIRPVVHTKYGTEIRKVLNSCCPKCGKLILDDEKKAEYKKEYDETLREKVEVGKAIERVAKKVKICTHCGHERELLKFIRPHKFFLGDRRLFPNEIREILSKVKDEDFELLGYDLPSVRPEWWILTVLNVPPVTMRPSIALETGQRSEDGLTHMLSNILRTNQRLKENINAGAPQIIIENMWDLLQYNITVYFDNTTSGVPPALDRSGMPLRTLVQRLSGKEGRFRSSLSGKRVD